MKTKTKTKTKTLLLSLTTALELSTAPAAWALETEWVATGTVYEGYDYTGVFGSAGADLTGDAFTADFYIDTSKGTEGYSPGDYDEVQGGSYLGDSTPVSASLEISGVKYYFPGDYKGFAATGLAYSGVDAFVSDDDDSSVAASSSGDGYPLTIGQSFSVSGNDGNGFTIINQASGELIVNNITSTGVITSAAPEPSAWALLIAGIGVSGLALRLRLRRGWAMA